MTKRSLLVIDDDPAICMMAATMTSSSFNVATVASRDGAVPLLERNFNIVLMDCQMPGMSAGAFLTLLRAASPASQVILMSGCCDATDAQRMGVQHFLPKPFSAPELLGILAAAVPEPASVAPK